jgi:hypothetical protein
MFVADDLRHDLNGALRGLWKSPGFAVAAPVTLASFLTARLATRVAPTIALRGQQ